MLVETAVSVTCVCIAKLCTAAAAASNAILTSADMLHAVVNSRRSACCVGDM